MPTQPPLMLGGLLVVVAGFISPPLAQAAGWLAYPFLAWTTGVVEAAARISYASVETGDIPGVAVGAYYLVLGALVAHFMQPRLQRLNVRQALPRLRPLAPVDSPVEDALVVKAGRHDNRKSVDVQWLQTLAPQFAVISVGADTKHAPASEAITQLSEAGVLVYRTDEHGTLTFRSDGERWWVEAGGDRRRVVRLAVAHRAEHRTNDRTEAQGRCRCACRWFLVTISVRSCPDCLEMLG